MSGRVQDDGVKHLTVANWLQPDEICRAFGEVNLRTGERRVASGDGWVAQFLAVELVESAPLAVRQMWEVAQGILCYGWFYYAQYAIGEHQLRRIADTAVLYRYRQAGGQPNKPGDDSVTWPSFKRRVEWLIEAGIIPTEKRDRWDVIRDLRNETTHADIRHLTPPTDVLRIMEPVRSTRYSRTNRTLLDPRG